MSEITIYIDGEEVKVSGDVTVLEAAKKAGIDIPTLCYHDKLEPYGACRLCTVEVDTGGRTRIVASCLYPVEQGIVVRTRSERIDTIRRVNLELLLSRAPEAEILQDLAEEYGANKDHFEKEASFCIHCGLCVRYCAEVKKKHAVGFINRGTSREIGFVPQVAIKECWQCRECFPLCPTEALQTAYLFTEALSSSTPLTGNNEFI